MKKHFYLLLSSLWLTISINAQNVGIGTTTPKAPFTVAAGKSVLFGSDTAGAGGKLMWIPSKYAFRAGGIGPVSVGQFTFNEEPYAWDSDSIGLFSFAGGYQNKAIAPGSTGFGALNSMRGWYSSALGYNNKVNGKYAIAFGRSNESTGESSVAIGTYNEVSTLGGFAFGYDNQLLEYYSFAVGSSNTCSESYAMALGHYNTVSNNYGTAVGFSNQVESVLGCSMGFGTINNSSFCTIVGSNNATLPTWSLSDWNLADPIFIVGNAHTNDSRSNAQVILKNGHVGFGTNTPAALIHGVSDSSPGNPQLMLEESSTDYARITFKNSNPGYWDIGAYCQPILGSNANAQLNFYFGSFGNVLSLKGNGNATLSGTLTQNSDIRLKKNIEPLSDALSRVLQINGYTYHWKDSLRGTDEQIGFIAQELEQQFPELVETDEEGMKSVAYSNMVPVLLEAIKEQQKEIDELKAMLKDK